MSGEKKRTYADLSIGGHHKDELPDKKQHVDNPAVYRVGPLQVAHAEADAHATAAPGSDLSLSHTQSSVPPLQTPPMQMPTHSGREPEGASEPQPQPGHAQAQAQAQAPGPGGDACATPEAPPAARSPKCDAVDVLSSDEEMEAAPVDGTPLPCRPAIPIHHFVRCDRVEAPGTWRALFACAQPIAEPDPVADYLVLTDKGSLAVVVELMEVSVCKYHVKGSPFVLVLECQLRGSVKGPVTVPGATPGASPGASPADHLRVYNRSEGPMDLQMRTVRSKWVLALEFSSADARAVQRALAPFPPGGHSEMSAAEARQYKAGTHPHLTQVDPPRTVGRKVTSDLRVAHRQGIAVTVGDYARLVPEIKNKRSAAQAHLNDSLIDFFIGQTAGTDDRFYVFTTEFYHMLCKAGKNMETCARTWAKNVALFKKPFVLVPINEQKHWTLLLICNLPALASAHGPGAGRAPFPPGSPTAGLPSVAADGAAPPGAAGTGEPPPATHPASPAGAPTFSDAGRDGACDPPGRAAPPGAAGASSLLQRGCYMLYLDSFRLNGDRHFRTIRRFLRHRYASEFGMEWGIPEALLPGRSPDVPMQHNQSDCGVYMLHFAERLARFLPQSPDSPVEEVVEALECPPSHIQNLRWQMQQKLKAVAPAEVMQHLQEYEELWEKVPPANDHIVAL